MPITRSANPIAEAHPARAFLLKHKSPDATTSSNATASDVRGVSSNPLGDDVEDGGGGPTQTQDEHDPQGDDTEGEYNHQIEESKRTWEEWIYSVFIRMVP